MVAKCKCSKFWHLYGDRKPSRWSLSKHSKQRIECDRIETKGTLTKKTDHVPKLSIGVDFPGIQRICANPDENIANISEADDNVVA